MIKNHLPMRTLSFSILLFFVLIGITIAIIELSQPPQSTTDCPLSTEVKGICSIDLVNLLTPTINRNQPTILARNVAAYDESIILHNVQRLLYTIKNRWGHDDIEHFFLELVALKKHHKRFQYTLLDYCYSEKIFSSPASLLIAIINQKHPEVLHTTLQWLKQKHISGHPSNYAYEEAIESCLKQALDSPDQQILETLISYGIHITKEKASQLLIYVVENSKSPFFIPILIQLGGNPNVNRTTTQSLLAYAIYHNTYPIVQMLVESGATNITGIPPISSNTNSKTINQPIRQLLMTYNIIES